MENADPGAGNAKRLQGVLGERTVRHHDFCAPEERTDKTPPALPPDLVPVDKDDIGNTEEPSRE
jgi:hypothetical protein